MTTLRRFLGVGLLILGTGYALAQETSLADRLLALPGVWVRQIEATASFTQAYEIRLSQPVDHTDPDGPRFEQRIYLSHRGFDRPVMMETEGYAAYRNSTKELAALLEANQLIVEHRYFGQSVPEKMDWTTSTSDRRPRITTASSPCFEASIPASGSTAAGPRAGRPPCTTATSIPPTWT